MMQYDKVPFLVFKFALFWQIIIIDSLELDYAAKCNGESLN